MVNGFSRLTSMRASKVIISVFVCSVNAHQPSLFTFDSIFMLKSYNLGFNSIYQVNLIVSASHPCTHYLLHENDFTFNIIVTTNLLPPFDSI